MTRSIVPSGRWVLASTLGLALGIPLGLAIGAPLEVLVGAMLVTPLMLGLVGLLVGTSQWSALRAGLPRAHLWIGLTAGGFAAGFTVAIVLVEQGGALLTGSPARLAASSVPGLALSLLIIGVVGGSAVGLAQSLAFPPGRRDVRRWTGASALGLTLGFLVGLTASMLVGGLTSAPGVALFLPVSGLVYAWVTGRVLSRIQAPSASP